VHTGILIEQRNGKTNLKHIRILLFEHTGFGNHIEHSELLQFFFVITTMTLPRVLISQLSIWRPEFNASKKTGTKFPQQPFINKLQGLSGFRVLSDAAALSLTPNP
jgi:hypothetical protein